MSGKRSKRGNGSGNSNGKAEFVRPKGYDDARPPSMDVAARKMKAGKGKGSKGKEEAVKWDEQGMDRAWDAGKEEDSEDSDDVEIEMGMEMEMEGMKEGEVDEVLEREERGFDQGEGSSIGGSGLKKKEKKKGSKGSKDQGLKGVKARGKK